MRCPLNPDIDLQAFRVAVFADMYDMAESPEAFDVEQYMQEMYELVFENTKDPALALDYTRFIPETALSLLNTDKNLTGKLINEKGLNLTSLMQKVIDISNYNKDQLEELNAQLSGKTSLEDVELQGQEAVNKQESEEETPLSAPVSKETLEEASKIEPLPVSTRPSTQPTLVDMARNVLKTVTAAISYPLTAFATRNVEKSQKHSKFFANVQRKILQQLNLYTEDYDNPVVLKDKAGNEVGKAFLTAVPSSEIIANLDKEGSIYYDFFRSMDEAAKEEFISREKQDNLGVVLVITDEAGVPIKFAQDGSPSLLETDSPAFLFLNDPTRMSTEKEDGINFQLSPNDEKAVQQIRDAYEKNNEPELAARAREIYEQELEAIRQIREFVKANPNVPIRFSITGGFSGYAVFDTTGQVKTRESLEKLEEDIQLELRGPKLQFNSDGLYGQPITIERPTLSEAGLLDDIVSLLTDELTYEGKPLSAELRKELLEQFYFTKRSRVELIVNKKTGESILYFKNKTYSIKDLNANPQQKEQLKEQLRSYLSEKRKGNSRFPADHTYVNPWRAGIKGQSLKEMSINDEGVLTLTERPYVDFVKEKFYIGYQIENGQIKKEQPYLTFQLTESSENKVFSEVKEEQDDVINSITNPNITDDIKQLEKERDQELFDSVRIPTMFFGQIIDKVDGSIIDEYDTVLDGQNKLKEWTEFYRRKEQEIINRYNEKIDELKTKDRENTPAEIPDDKPVINDNYIDDWNDRDDDILGMDKTEDVKKIDVKATKEQIKEAKKWYEKSAISQFFKFEEMFDMVNTDDGSAIARWTLAGITLYKGSDYSDLYHEAWHAFTQTFMNSLQRQDLYKKLKTKSGTFTDHLGQTVTFKDASDLQLEEHLAEQFREYMLNPSSKKITKEEKSLFRRVLQALRKLFGDREADLEITNLEADLFVQDIFEKLRIGKLKEYSFNRENAVIPALDKGGVKALKDYNGVQQLNYNNTMKMVSIIDSLISEWIDLKNAGLNKYQIAELFNINDEIEQASNDYAKIKELEAKKEEILSLARKQIKATYKYTSGVTKNKEALLSAYNHAAYRIARIIRNKEALYNATENVVDKERIKKQLDLLNWSLKNFGNLDNINHVSNRPGPESTGLIAMHKERSAQFFNESVKTTLDFENVTEEELLQGKLFDKAGNEQSMVEIAKPEVIFFLKQLYSYNKEGLIERDEFGLPKQADFGRTWNKLARLLTNTPNLDQMYVKLQAASVKDPQIKQVLDKLGNTQVDSQIVQSLWSNFFNTFGMANVPLIQVTIRRDPKTGAFFNTTGKAFGSQTKIAKDWERKFKEPGNSSPFIKRDDKGNYLDVKAFLEKYPPNQVGNNLIARNPLQFFSDLGITLTDNEDLIKELKDLKNKDIYPTIWVRRNLQKIVNEAKKDEDLKIRDLKEISKLETRLYNNLIELETTYSDVFSNFMVTNAEGNTQFEHTLNNTITMMVNGINSVNTYQELLNVPHLAHLDVNLNPFAESSIWLKSMFNLEGTRATNPEYGQRRKDRYGKNILLEVVNLSGIISLEGDSKIQEGISSAKADQFTKFILDMHLGYDNSLELMRHSDKATSFGIRLTGESLGSTARKDSYMSSSLFTESNAKVAADVKNKILPYLIAELKRMRIARTALKDKIKDFDFAYLERGQNFVNFSGYLNADTKALLIDKIIENESLDLEDFAEEIAKTEFNDKILRDTQEYFFDKQYAKVKPIFENTNEFVADNVLLSFKSKKENRSKNLSDNQIKEALLKSLIVNTFLNNLESMSVIYGDLAQYKIEKEDFHKRNAGAGSTGKLFRTDVGMQNFINSRLDKTYAAKLKDELGLTSLKKYDGTFNTAVISDNEIPSVYAELRQLGKAYNEMEEADGQGIIAFDSYRALKIAEGDWSPQQEALYQDIINEREIDETKIQYYFPAYKTQYWGPLKTDLERIGLPVTAFHKFSLYPAIPNVIKGKNMDILHKRMIQEGIDYVVFKSGSKVGTITETQSGTKQAYKKDSRELVFDNNYDPSKDKPFFTKNVIFLEYLKNQLEINDKAKGQTIFSTQLRKLVIDGLMEFGVPVDYKTNIKDPQRRIKAWENEKNKTGESDYYRLILDYENTIGSLVKLAKAEVLKELDWTEAADGTLSGNRKKLMDFIIRELSRKELGEHELEYLLKGNDLSLSLNAADVEKMLNALIVKKLVKQKVNGEALIQVANTFMEETAKAKGLKFKNPTKEQIKEFGSNDLPFYTKNKDGSTNAMKVKIALQNDFKNLLYLEHNDGQEIGTIERLNEMIKDEKWLNKGDHRKMITMTAVRIPVQGLNSMEFMEVYEFLPASASGTIILPSEIVAKSGADFDIDKLTVMMPNIKLNITKEKLKSIRSDLKTQFPDLDFSWDNVNMIMDAMKDPETYKFLNENDIAVANAIRTKRNKVSVEYAKGDNKRGLENKLITSIVNILSLPVNRKALLTPNSTALFTEGKNEGDKSLVDALAKDEEYNGTTTFEIAYNLKKHQENSVGKAALGLGAVDNTYNTLMNRVGAYLNDIVGYEQDVFVKAMTEPILTKEEEATLNYVEKRVLREERFNEIKTIGSKYRRQKIFLPHNTIGNNISLSHSTSKGSNQSISDIINQMINGWVDVARGAWIFNVQGNKEVAPTLLFMIQAGIPVDTAVYFVSNPLIKQYVEEIRKAQSPFARAMGIDITNENQFRAVAIARVLTNNANEFSIPNITGTSSPLDVRNVTRTVRLMAALNVNNDFDVNKLKDRAENYKEGDPITKEDRDAFLHFLELEEMGKAVRDIKMNMNFDTNPDQSLYAAEARIKRKGSLEYDDRFPSFIIEKLEKESPIAPFFTQPFQLELISRLFPLRNHKAINDYIDEIPLKDIKKNGWRDRESFAKDFKNEFVNFIYQNELKNFNFDSLSKTYKGNDIVTNVQVGSLKYGAIYKDGKLYISLADLANQYRLITNRFTGNNLAEQQKIYNSTGLAPVHSQQFNSFQEYVQFVLERERLRKTLSLEQISKNLKFLYLLEEIKDYYENTTAGQTQVANYSPEVKERFIINLAKETFLKNQALENTLNNDYMFKGSKGKYFQKSYAERYIELNSVRFPQLKSEFALLNYLEFSESPLGYKNLKFSNPKLDADQKNVFYENLEDLTNASTLKEKFPSLTDAEISYIVDFFSDFANYAYLQTGLNTRSSFSLTGAVDPEEFSDIAEEAKGKAMAVLDKGGLEAFNLLESFYHKFDRNNGNNGRAVKGRGVNYKVTDTVFTEDGIIEVDAKVKRRTFLQDEPAIELQAGITSEITKSNYTRAKVKADPNTAYVFTENNYSITAFPNRQGGGSAIIRPEANAFAIVTKKKYDYNTGENVDYSDTEADFKEFTEVNTRLINKLKNSGKTKIIFPQGFASDKAKLPTRFAEWLQGALLDNFGLVTELNANKTGLISKSIQITTQQQADVEIIDKPLTNEEKLDNLERDLAFAEQELERLEEMDEYNKESNPYLYIVDRMPIINTDSARAETGVGVGTKKDISPSLVSNTSKYSVERAAEEIEEDAEGAGIYLKDIDVRQEIIEILQKGKKNYINEYSVSAETANIKNRIKELKNEIRELNKPVQLNLFDQLSMGLTSEEITQEEQEESTEGKYQTAKSVFNNKASKESVINEIANNPDIIYIYESTEQQGAGSGQGEYVRDVDIRNSGLKNIMPLRVNKAFTPKNNFKDVKDADGNMVIDPALKELIDADIQDLLAISNRPMMFKATGYGQQLLKVMGDNKNMVAPQGFIYLSEQLLEKFGYINPGFLSLDMSGKNPGIEAVQEAQEISDVEIKELNRQAVLDLMKLCKL